MCGIAAIVSGDKPVSAESLAASTALMACRGPDGAGQFVSPNGRVGLGHTRLGIIDPGGGAQPIASEDGRLVIVANGEFYGFEQIRRGLEGRGHRFRTGSDSEIALHLYEDLGPRCLEQLRGEFALVIWDGRDGTLFAARDRFGIKPLFFAQVGNRLLAASEVRALFALGVAPAWDVEMVYQNLFVCVNQDRTLFKNVRQVPPGHYLIASGGDARLVSYWDQDYPHLRQMNGARDEAAWLEELRSALDEAIELRLRSDVPIGCYLSGGLDSASVLGVARRMGVRVAAFTVAFDHPAYDESAIARRMAEYAGVDFYPVPVSEADAADVFEEAVAQGENIHYNAHGAARYLLSRAVSEAGYKTVLAGEGSDELFAGYDFSSRALEASAAGNWVLRWLRVGAALLWPLSAPERIVAETSPFLARLARVLGFPRELVESMAEKLALMRSLLAPDLTEAFRPTDPYRDFMRQFDRRRQLGGREPVKQVLYLWMKSLFLNYVLAAERLDAANAVEVRLPFLDHKLFELIRAVPARLLLHDGQRKHLLREAVRDVITDEIYRGAKNPFVAPPAALRPGNPLYIRLQDLLRSADFATVPFFDRAAVLRFLDRLPTLDDRARSSLDPLLFMMASLAVLHRTLAPATGGFR